MSTPHLAEPTENAHVGLKIASRPLTARRLWRLFAGKHFARLSPEDLDTLHTLTTSAPRHLHELPTLSATAACLLWYLGPVELHDDALALLTSRPLPGELLWQRVLARKMPHDALLELIRVLLRAGFHESAASLASASLSNHVRTRSKKDIHASRMRACDLVSQSAPQRFRDLLELMCDATLDGQLDLPWLEWPMRACIRLNIDRPLRQRTLREFYASQPFDAPLERIATLYTPIIHAEYLSHGSQIPRHVLLQRHAQSLLTAHPRRAQHLLELATVFTQRTGAVTLKGKLRRALARYDSAAAFSQDDPIPGTLAHLYIMHHAIEPARVAFVERVLAHTDLLDALPERTLQTYLLVGNYERAFEHLTCTYDGVRIQHIDKDAATRVTYYVEKYPTPRLNAQIFDLAMAPVGWVQQTLRDIQAPRQIANQLLLHYRRRLHTLDQRSHALTRLHHLERVEEFEDIAHLPLHHIEDSLQPLRARHLSVAAIAGGLSALAGSIGPGGFALLDVPIMLLLVTRLCHNLCWIYGFDPVQHPGLVDEILHTALWGPKPAKVQSSTQIHGALEDLAVRKSLITGAIARGAVTRSSLHMIQHWIEDQSPSPSVERSLDLTRQFLQRTMPRRPTQIQTARLISRWLPGVGAAIGALLNATFVYDLFEAAQAVLTDRFLDRKYPNWPTHFALTDGEEEE